MKILGIDPGLQTIGFGVLESKALTNFGVIKTASELELSERLRHIANDLHEVINKCKPDVAAVEKLFFVQNVTNGIAVAHARGVILYVLAEHGIPLLEVQPKDVKLAVCGYGNAPKEQVQKAVQQIFKLKNKPQPDDAADAIAVAYWASGNREITSMTL